MYFSIRDSNARVFKKVKIGQQYVKRIIFIHCVGWNSTSTDPENNSGVEMMEGSRAIITLMPSSSCRINIFSHCRPSGLVTYWSKLLYYLFLRVYKQELSFL